MALTVHQDDPSVTLKTQAGYGIEAMDGALVFIGKGTGGRSTCIIVRNSQEEVVFARAADAQTSFEVAATQPV